ncbi:mannosyltransferase family protein [Planosporangium sp. 12N6]|uniref:mannosyltransferase family protein n=1 Tax=Planosporangium spinosum TaxID=3402278 RepID=UPI003CFA420B
MNVEVLDEQSEVDRETAEAESTEDQAPSGRPWRRALLAGLLIWISSRVGLAGVTAISWISQGTPHLTVRAVAYKWAMQWDSTWFLAIAQQGYVRDPDESQAAFFPLYPALVRLFAPVFFGKIWVSGLFVANVALLAALVLLYRLTEHEFGRAPAGRSIFYLVAFPTGFFLTAAYNEGLFIALMVAAVYAMRRGHWWWAGVAGAFAASARSAGILLVLAFGFEYLRQHGRRLRLDVLAIGLMPLGLVAVMIVDKLSFGNPFAFSDSQSAHWGRHLSWPWTAIVDSASMLGADDMWRAPFSDIWAHNVLELGTTLLALVLVGLAFVGPWRVRRDQLVLPLLGLGLILFMVSFPSSFKADIPSPLVSTSRIGIEVFPAFMMMGRLGRNPWIDRTLLALFLPMQGILAAHFLHSGWVA